MSRKRRGIWLMICIVLLVFCVSCKAQKTEPQTHTGSPNAQQSTSPAPQEEQTATPEQTAEASGEIDYIAATTEFVNHLLDENYDGCAARFDAQLAAQIDAAGLEQMWEGVVGTCGTFVGLDTDRGYTRQYNTFFYSTVFCEFEQNGIAVTALYGNGTNVLSLVMNYYTPLSRLTYDTQSEATPLLWKVSDPQGTGELFLMGSFHLGDETLYGMPQAVMDAYEASDALALEYDLVEASLDLVLYLQGQMALTYQDGTTIQDHIGPDTYEKAVAFMTEQGIYNAMYESISAPAWHSMIQLSVAQMAGLDGNYGVDRYFASLAHAEKKPILEIESQEFQMNLMRSTPDELWDFYISVSVDESEQAQELIRELYEAYLTGDEALLYELIDDDRQYDANDPAFDGYTEEEKTKLLEDIAEYDEKLMTERNEDMADKAQEYLASGDTVFFLVGAAHMLGEDGLVTQLTEAGYIVELVRY